MIQHEYDRRHLLAKQTNTQFPDSLFTSEYGEENVPSIPTLSEMYCKSVDMLLGTTMNKHFAALTSDMYMADATFKVLTQVTYKADNGKRVKPHAAMYTIMCSTTHRIVQWQLCVSTDHNSISQTWKILDDRHKDLNVPPPKVVALDNCCQDDSVIRSVFPETCVALDTMHWMNRIMRTLRSSRHPHSSRFINGLSAVLYGEENMSAAERLIRKKFGRRKLQPQNILVNNLTEYMIKWKTMPSPISNPNVGPLFTSSTWDAFENAIHHIRLGCLNNGDVDEYRSWNSTSPLQSLHSKINTFEGVQYNQLSHGLIILYINGIYDVKRD